MKRRYPSTDMAKCQYQPQFGCWPGAGLAVGAVARDGCLAFRRRLGRRPWPNPTPNPATPAATRKCSLAMAQGRALAGQLGAYRCRWRPGPGRNPSEARAGLGALESIATPRVGAQGGNPHLDICSSSSSRTRHTTPKAKESASKPVCLYTKFVSVDTGNANRESNEVEGMSSNCTETDSF